MMPQKNAPQQLDARGGDVSSPDPHGGETVGVRRKFEAKKGVVPARGKFEVKKAGSPGAGKNVCGEGRGCGKIQRKKSGV